MTCRNLAFHCLWLATWLLSVASFGAQNVKTLNGVAIANVKTVNGVARANVKTINGVDNTSGGGSYTYYSTVFDGTNDYLTRGANFTGLSDGQAGLISFWIKLDAGSSDSSYVNIFTNDSFQFAVFRDNSGGEVQFRGKNAATSNVLLVSSNANSLIASSGWVHFLASWDLGTAGRRYVYVNGSDQTNVTTFTTSETIDYARSNFSVGSGTDASGKLNGLLCEFYFTNEWLDISNSANRAKFRTAGGKPEDLGATGSTPTGTQPILYLKNVYSSFETNAGSGGGLTENGTLGDGGADIP